MSTIDNELPLSQYLSGAVEGLNKGEISPSGFATNLFHYTEGKAFFIQNIDLADTLLDPDNLEKAIEVALQIAENPYAFLSKESPTSPHTEDEQTSAIKILSDRKPEANSFSMQPEEFRSSLLKKRQEAVKKQTDNISVYMEGYRKELIKKQRQSALGSQDEIIIEELNKSPKSKTLDGVYDAYRQRLEASTALNEEARELAYKIIEDKEFQKNAWDIEQKTRAATKAYLEHPDSPPELVTTFIDASFSGPSNFGDPLTASRIQYIAGKPPADTKNIPAKQAYPEYNQGSNKEGVISHAYSARIIAATKDKDKLAQKIVEKSGGVASESEVLHILKEAENEATKRDGGKVKAWASSIDETSDYRERIMHEGQNYLIGAITGNQAPSAQGMFKSVAFGRRPEEFHFTFDPGISTWALNIGKGGVERGVLGAGAKRVGTEALLKLGINAGSKLMGFAPVVGWTILAASAFSGTIKKFGASAFSGFLNGGIVSIRAASGAVTGIVQNMLGATYTESPADKQARIWALAVVSTTFIWIFFSTFRLNETRTAQFFSVGTGGSSESSETGGGVIDCNDPSVKLSNPVCTYTPCVGDCRWPTSGYITQGPRASCGSHSGGTDENAIDIATGGGGVPVYAMLTGTVTSVHSDCVDNTGNPKNLCGKSGYEGYGNHVVVTGVDKDGIPYTVIFGHLSSAIDIQDVDPAKPGIQVTPTSQVGIMDQTGASSGDHLHFGVLSGGNVLNLLPVTPGLGGCNVSCGDCPGKPISTGG